MTESFRKFLASILIMSDNEYDRSDLASLGKTLEQAETMPTKSVNSRVHDDEACENGRELENN